MKKPIVCCDFDGTITKNDNIIRIMKHFAPSEWTELKDDVLAKEITIQEGVGQMFQLLTSDQKEAIQSFILEDTEIREGFKQFVDHVKKADIPFYVLSGGMDFLFIPYSRALWIEPIFTAIMRHLGKSIFRLNGRMPAIRNVKMVRGSLQAVNHSRADL